MSVYKLRILHLSDLHERVALPWMQQERQHKVRNGEGQRYRVLGDQFDKVLREIRDAGPVDLVCFTGDVADWGLREEYEAATPRFLRILEQVKVPRERLFVVPGNHDVQRREKKGTWKKMRDLAEADADGLGAFMAGGTVPFGAQKAWRSNMATRTAAFWRWVDESLGRRALVPRPDGLHPSLGYRETVEIPGFPFPIHVVGLDSAWLAGANDDAKKLRISAQQIDRLVRTSGAPLSGFRLALVHHPLSELADTNECQRLLADTVDLLLHGHQHQPIATEQWDPDRRLAVIAAGSLFEGDLGDRWVNGFHLVEIHLDKEGNPLKYEIEFWGWSTRGFWHRDGSIYENAREGRLTWTPSRGTLGTAPPFVAHRIERPVHSTWDPLADFAGRNLQLNELHHAKDIKRCSVIIVSGEGGVGKTQLARKFAQEIAKRFAGGLIEIDMLGTSATPLPAMEAMKKVVSTLEPFSAMPESADDIATKYRSCLHGRKVLMLLDNVRDRAQVEPLNPPPSEVMILVTCRQHFVLPGGAHTLRLPRFSRDESMQLLRAINKRIDGEEADHIASLCCGIPLAVRIVASTLLEQDDLSAADMIAKLRTSAGRQKVLEPVKLAFEFSLSTLRGSEVRLWSLLGVFAGAFDCVAAAEVGGVEPDPAADSLRILRQHNLLDWNQNTKHYSMHDLARDHALRLLDDASRQSAEKGHARYLAKNFKRAIELNRSGGEGTVEALQVFERHWNDVQSLRRWALSSIESNDVAACIAWGLAETCDGFAKIRMRASEYVEWCETGLRSARALGKRANGAAWLLRLGSAHASTGNWARARMCIEDALAESRSDGDKQGEMFALGHLGSIYFSCELLGEAAKVLESSLALACELGNRKAEEDLIGQLWVLCFYRRDYGRAIDLLARYERVVVERKDLVAAVVLHLNAGAIFIQLGGMLGDEPNLEEIQWAMQSLRKAVQGAYLLRDRELLTSALWYVGIAHAYLGNPESCQIWMTACIDYYRSEGSGKVDAMHREMESWLRMARARPRKNLLS